MRENVTSTARRFDRTTVPNNSAPTTKQLREEQRAAKVAALKEKQKREKRNKIIGIVSASLLAAGVLALVLFFIISSAQPPFDRSTPIKGVKTWELQAGNHVDQAEGVDPNNPPAVDYEAELDMNPPAGGPHWLGLLNCGVYTEPQPNERAVHSLEHGAVWITYNPEEVSDDEIKSLQDAAESTYMLVSPYPDLPSPIVVSAWGAQLVLDGVDDPRLDTFIQKYRNSPDGPEFGAPCTGGLDGPGKIA